MRLRRSAAGLAACLVLGAALSEAPLAGRPKIYRISGAVKNEKKKFVPVEILEFTSAGIRASMRYLDGPARRGAIASVLGSPVDLFPERTPGTRGFLVFALEIHNDGPSDLLVEPGQSRLATDKADMEFPLEVAALHEVLRRSGGGRQPISLEEAEKAVLARGTTIRPGGAIRKLLVFEGPREDRFKSLEVRLMALHHDAGDLDATFKFRKFEVTP